MDDEETWTGFIEFIRRAPAAQHPGVLFEGFRADLVARGLADDDAARQMQRLMDLTRERQDWAGPMFDRIYTSDSPQFRSDPNAFLVRVCAGRSPGRALDFDYGIAAWDLVVASYALVPITSPAFARTVIEALRPGGLFVVESFATVGGKARRPVDVDPDALRAAYGDLRTVADEVGESVADWTLVSETVVRFAAERSAA